ncbi:hypothetical protein [Roseivivax sp. THAF197b]|uniref:hypothetical protein n=1 Tax=Roseivivax sp. THAF197b TaxID=2588299 RepID=UPI0012695E61|nr:hypothetical protein [Roseivivax sp. THAF197b]QFS82351.1 hypothetical protein FIV09_05885 [Roseivivax sp. THAF197b]
MGQLPKIALPLERYQQLVDLRDLLNAPSFSAAIGELIKTFAEIGKIEHSLPGVDIRAATDGFVIRFDGTTAAGMSYEDAMHLVGAIREYLADTKPRKTALAHPTRDFIVKGIGRSVAIQFIKRKITKQFAPDIAADFADLLERNIAQANT